MGLPAEIDQKHRARMEALEAAIVEELEPAEMEEVHHYADGTYTRELRIPEGTVLTGKIHRESCINILAKGKMKVITDEGIYDIEAPHVFVSGAGVKKAGYAITDAVWINVHPWNGEDDLVAIENKQIIPSYEALEQEMQLALEHVEQ